MKKVLNIDGKPILKDKFHVPEAYRIEPPAGLPNPVGTNNGYFMIPVGNKDNMQLCCLASDGLGWDHVSVQVLEKGKEKIPSWEVMEFVRQIFWGPDATVVQIHPPNDDYVNNHPCVLHLWRWQGEMTHRPPSELVGLNPGKQRPPIDPKIYDIPSKK